MHTAAQIDANLQPGTAPADFHPTAHKELLAAYTALAGKTYISFATLAAAQAAGAGGQLTIGQIVMVG